MTDTQRAPLPMFVAGEWVLGSGPTIRTINPADGSYIADISTATKIEIDAAVASAKAAVRSAGWRQMKAHHRAAFLYRMSELIEQDSERLARVQMNDNGKTLAECRRQIASAAGTFRYYAAACETREGSLPARRSDAVAMAIAEPIGVVAAITPWNSPTTLEAQKLAPILAAGNAVVLKPSEVTPLMALEYARIGEKAGLPKGVLNVVVGTGAVGGVLVEHPDVNMVSFTGGSATGSKIAAACGALLKPVLLELGGKSPNIVFADADMRAALAGVSEGIFSGAGQSCVAGSRIFVEKSIYKEFVSSLVEIAKNYRIGLPHHETTQLGPLVNFEHRDKVAAYVELGRQEGGRVLVGGGIPTNPDLSHGAYFEPTLLEGLSPKARVCQEEIFGPVGVILPFESEDELIALANDSEFGLAAGLWTSDYKRAWRVGERLDAGTVWLNTYKDLSISTPFGGYKKSGLGQEKGLQGLDMYSRTKSLHWALDKPNLS
ncbi:aldehyde dehydrogenase [Paraburkholderia aspalathi]|uniref:aldehyde dehydrogenase n=1 Tax=Paraburkholderia aspalathi TaxID=1324617 RepID=UPI001B1C56D3|nr:aldehyde dehydrogenase [Paraburkholderia aspalathi]CAE6738065.1 Betaine aldehyde dehydrogenase [Paraburkholderia aspalathi]